MCVEKEEQYVYWDIENTRYVCFSQIFTFGTVAHIFYGNFILSGYQLINLLDAPGIVERYMASAWIS